MACKGCQEKDAAAPVDTRYRTFSCSIDRGSLEINVRGTLKPDQFQLVRRYLEFVYEVLKQDTAPEEGETHG